MVDFVRTLVRTTETDSWEKCVGNGCTNKTEFIIQSSLGYTPTCTDCCMETFQHVIGRVIEMQCSVQISVKLIPFSWFQNKGD